MEQMIEMLKNQYPDMSAVFDVMFSKESIEKSTTDDIDFEEVKEDSELNLLKEQLAKLQKINQKLFKINELLSQNLSNELDQNNILAKAIGACQECFGYDKSCQVCHGKGSSGFYIPDFVLFHKYVQPAIKKFNKHYLNIN
jgi:hypothetical protein